MAVPFAARSDAGRLIKHRASTNFNDDQPESSAKRLKRFASTDSSCPSDSSAEGRHTPDPDRTAFSSYFSRETNAATDDSRADHGDPAPSGSQTDLESVLPAVKTDQTAIEDYETSSLAEKDGGLTLEQRIESGKWVKGRSSIYVDAFNLALETVLEDEKHLFDEPELALFDQWRELPYEAQYLSVSRYQPVQRNHCPAVDVGTLTASRYVRLFLRKTSRWHRISRLGYYSDIADMKAAVECLREVRLLPPSTAPSEPHPGELEPPVDTLLGSTFRFADGSNDDVKTLEEASSLLDLDELKALAKDGKIQGKNKSELLKALRRTSQKQSSLGWSKLPRTDTESSAASSGGSESRHAASPTGGPNDPLLNRDEYYIRKILAWTGPCIRVALAPLRLFERVHLVFYRSTEWTEKSLTTLILARISRKNFPRYIISRSANIFASRALLLEFEAAIRTQFHVDSILEFNGNPTQEGLQQVLDVFDKVYPRWKILLQEEQAKEGTTYEIGEGTYLRRFSPAWVYTRIVHKAAYVLGRLKMHKREHDMLSELLDQQLFHPSRRGGWYQRKALLEEHYMFDLTPCDGRTQDSQKKRWKQIALHTCEEGLQDRDCHLIYHYDLQKRISKLERSLRVAKREQHDFGHARLVKPFERHVEGIRLQKESGVGNPKAIKRSSSSESNVTARGTKTTWIDDHDGGGECGVEEMCLSWYRQQGWKGYHCEGAIIRTLVRQQLLVRAGPWRGVARWRSSGSAGTD